MDKAFNLLDEPWIKVLDFNNRISEVSLTGFFENAHNYRQLAGETVTQDIAILRVLLAVTETVFYRYNSDGQEDDILEVLEPEEEILERWKEYWNRGKFEGNVFRDYLDTYRERFFLFHPKTPFWQTNELPKEATEYGVINLYGNIKESNNVSTRHHFQVRDGKAAEDLSYAEATRWLIYNNAFSVNVKTKVGGENKAVGVGRLGQLGLIMADEDNLFRILMINLCALDGNGRAWKSPNPIWEQEPRKKPGVEIVPPDNLPEKYTLQSRRLLLKHVNGKITGFFSIGGDYYSTVNDLREPMTLLQYREREKVKEIIPKRHKKEVMVWRELPSILVQQDECKPDAAKPGLLVWIRWLQRNRLLSKNKYITFQMIGLEYGDGMSYTNGEIFSQSLTLSKKLLEDIGDVWILDINDEVEKCEKVAGAAFFVFSKRIADSLYKGDSQKRKMIQDWLAGEYYFNIDQGFRHWLIGIDPENDSREEKRREWEIQSACIANDVTNHYIERLSPQSMIVASDARKWFGIELCKIYHLGEKGKEGED